jgi:hypothetical protein
LLDAGIQRFGLIYVPVKIQFDVSSWNASNTIFKDYSSDLATDRWCVLLLAEDTPIVVFTDPWIFADRLIFGLLVIINYWEFLMIGIRKNRAGAPRPKKSCGDPTEFVMIGILSIFAD